MNWKNFLTCVLGITTAVVSHYVPAVAEWLPLVGAGLAGAALPQPFASQPRA
jgi:hypothetical protein